MTAVFPFPSQTDPLPNTAMPSIGTILRKARDERGLTIEHCADILKIRRIYLEALENNNWNELPDLVYATGFVRSYANFLGLDGERVVAQLKNTHRGINRKSDLEMPVPMHDMQSPNKYIIIGAAIILLLIYVAWALLAPRPARDPIMPPPTTAANPVTAPTTTAATTPAVTNTAPVANDVAPAPSAAGQIVIRVIADSWVQIRGDNGQVILSRLLRKGESYQIPGTGQAKLTTGNLAGLQFDLDGKTLPPVVKSNGVVRDIPLTANSLLQVINQTNAAAPPSHQAAPVQPAASATAEETGD